MIQSPTGLFGSHARTEVRYSPRQTIPLPSMNRIPVIFDAAKTKFEEISHQLAAQEKDLVYESRLLREVLKNNERSVKKLDKDDYTNGEEEVFQINVS